MGSSPPGSFLHRIAAFHPAVRIHASKESLDPVPQDLRARYPTVFPDAFVGGTASAAAPEWWKAFGDSTSWRWAAQAYGIGWSFDTVAHGPFPSAHFLRDIVKSNHESCYAPGVKEIIDDMVSPTNDEDKDAFQQYGAKPIEL